MSSLLQVIQCLNSFYAFDYGMVDQMRKGVKTLDHLEEGGHDVRSKLSTARITDDHSKSDPQDLQELH